MRPKLPAPQSPIIAEAKRARLALSPRQQAFVEAYARPGTKNGELALNASEAARRAGYSPNRVNSTVHKLLKMPKIAAAVAAMRAEVAERAGYTVERCMAELEQGMSFALKTENASAYVRAVELRAKLTGILVDRVDMRAVVGTFAINVIGLTDGVPGG